MQNVFNLFCFYALFSRTLEIASFEAGDDSHLTVLIEQIDHRAKTVTFKVVGPAGPVNEDKPVPTFPARLTFRVPDDYSLRIDCDGESMLSFTIGPDRTLMIFLVDDFLLDEIKAIAEDDEECVLEPGLATA